jgi:hypothetical protein
MRARTTPAEQDGRTQHCGSFAGLTTVRSLRTCTAAGPRQHRVDVGLVLLEGLDEPGVPGVVELDVARLAAHRPIGGRRRHPLSHLRVLAKSPAPRGPCSGRRGGGILRMSVRDRPPG